MIRTFVGAALGAALLCVGSVAGAAVTFTSVAAPADYSTANAGTITYDFDARTPANEGGAVVSGTTGTAAQPVGAAGSYYAVGPDNGKGGGVGALYFDASARGYSTVSFILGSADSYNSLQFFGQTDSGVFNIGQLFTGGDITAPAAANGDQGSALTNRLVTFTFTGADTGVRGLRLGSAAANALEVDSFTLGAGAVPEPATWAMMIGGVGLTGGALRSRRRRGLALA